MILKRFFDEKPFEKLKVEFAPILDIMREPANELSLSLGNNNFGLFLSGISMAKVEFSIFGGLISHFNPNLFIYICLIM